MNKKGPTQKAPAGCYCDFCDGRPDAECTCGGQSNTVQGILDCIRYMEVLSYQQQAQLRALRSRVRKLLEKEGKWPPA